jgi:hypothetical protein
MMDCVQASDVSGGRQKERTLLKKRTHFTGPISSSLAFVSGVRKVEAIIRHSSELLSSDCRQGPSQSEQMIY